MIVDIATLRYLLDVIKFVAINLMEIYLRGNIVEFAANQIVDPHHLMTLSDHSVGQVAAEKTRDTGYKDFHRPSF